MKSESKVGNDSGRNRDHARDRAMVGSSVIAHVSITADAPNRRAHAKGSE